MNKTITFKDVENKFQFTVMKNFLNKCSNSSQYEAMDLLHNYKINYYFHNPNGPAIVRLRDGAEEYWLNGKWFKDEFEWKLEVSRK